MIIGIEVPLEAAGAAWLAAFALGALVGRRQAPVHDPLKDLFARSERGRAIDYANRWTPGRSAAQAVLHARVDQFSARGTGWDARTREQVLGQIAAVMKAGIRREDRFTRVAGEGFTIVMSGADERAARGVAERLRRALAQIKLPKFGGDGLFTASFGVAAGTTRDNGDMLVARALAALDAAQQSGSDHVVAASEIEEVILLPAPDPAAKAA